MTIDTISGGPDMMPDRSRFHVPPELADVHANSDRMVPGHILTGTVAVEGAVPGIDAEAFAGAAETAKENCPVSKALAGVPEMTVEATLRS